MSAITYKNTKTNISGWVNNLHQTQTQGYAYYFDNYFVHIYGASKGIWSLSTGLTASQHNDHQIDLQTWIKDVFGADQIQPMIHQPGEVVNGVWRPGLYYEQEIFQAFNLTEHDQRSAEQALRILIIKLDELFLYIEPDTKGLLTYSHKTRELLILACTEVENAWRQYLTLAGAKPIRRNYTTNDYVKLKTSLFLDEYEIKLKPYKDIKPINPFAAWNSSDPTKSLTWYNSYNKTKHDRQNHFGEATLDNCVQAIAANIVLFCVRFGPYPLFSPNGLLASVASQLFDIRLVNPDPTSFYIPKMEFKNHRTSRLVCGDAKEQVLPWKSKKLTI